MTKRKVWRYRCDFCKKSGCSASAMTKHERHCTLNPARECRCCKGRGEVSRRRCLSELVEIARHVPPTKDGCAELMDAAAACPMCTFSAIRQSGRTSDAYGTEDVAGEPPIIVSGIPFDLKASLAQWWTAENAERAGAEYY